MAIERKLVTVSAIIQIDTEKFDTDGLMLCLDMNNQATAFDYPATLTAGCEGFEVEDYEQFEVEDLDDEDI